MKKVKLVQFNWFQAGSVTDRDGAGEDFTKVEVGKHGVVAIEENEPHNGMQLWNYVVHYEDKASARIFNPNYV